MISCQSEQNLLKISIFFEIWKPAHIFRNFFNLYFFSFCIIFHPVRLLKPTAYRESRKILCSVQNDQKLLYKAELVFDHFVQLHMNFVLSGKLHVSSQQIFFSVNRPFVCSCLGLIQICLNSMRFTCFWTSNCSGKNFVLCT